MVKNPVMYVSFFAVSYGSVSRHQWRCNRFHPRKTEEKKRVSSSLSYDVVSLSLAS
jgi:hypothetical protein